MRDTLARLCADSSGRIPKWLVPVIRHRLPSGGEIGRSALVVAAWVRYPEGVDEHGEPIGVVDRRREEVMAAAARQRAEPLAFLSNRALFGDLVDDLRFVAAYTTGPEVAAHPRCPSDACRPNQLTQAAERSAPAPWSAAASAERVLLDSRAGRTPRADLQADHPVLLTADPTATTSYQPRYT